MLLLLKTIVEDRAPSDDLGGTMSLERLLLMLLFFLLLLEILLLLHDGCYQACSLATRVR